MLDYLYIFLSFLFLLLLDIFSYLRNNPILGLPTTSTCLPNIVSTLMRIVENSTWHLKFRICSTRTCPHQYSMASKFTKGTFSWIKYPTQMAPHGLSFPNRIGSVQMDKNCYIFAETSCTLKWSIEQITKTFLESNLPMCLEGNLHKCS